MDLLVGWRGWASPHAPPKGELRRDGKGERPRAACEFRTSGKNPDRSAVRLRWLVAARPLEVPAAAEDETVGYLKRKLDRGRSGRDVARHEHEGAWDEECARWTRARWAELERGSFVRFSVAARDEDSGRRQGVFAAIYALLDEDALEPELALHVTDTLAWFAENLLIPDLDEDRAIFLYRADAEDCIRRMWDLVWVLREQGLDVELQTTRSPGRTVYEDAHQVAVIPWSESREL